jgi:hypothetical protein
MHLHRTELGRRPVVRSWPKPTHIIAAFLEGTWLKATADQFGARSGSNAVQSTMIIST